MREMMQKLNVVKYTTSEEQKKELINKGFLPVKSKVAVSSPKKDKKAVPKASEKTNPKGDKGPEKQGEENG